MKQAYFYLHKLSLFLLTIGAATVMWWVSSGGGKTVGFREVVAPVSEYAEPRAPVSVMRLEPADCPVYEVYTGTIRPWETYTVGFEIAGRVASLGLSSEGRSLDDGDRVLEGDLLARLDDEIFVSRVEETSALLELADSEKRRAEKLRTENAISEAEYLKRLTEGTQARSQHKIAEQNLIDASLLAPASGTIARRRINVGESVAPHQSAFTIVEDDRVILAVEVPESRIHDLQQRLRQVESAGSQRLDPAFRAIVFLEGRDRFGRRRESMEGYVHHIANVANPMSGTFEVEIALDNRQHLLSPGMVATAWIEITAMHAYRLPESAVVFRENRGYVFTLERETAQVEAFYWPVGETEAYRARMRPLEQYIEQRPLPQPVAADEGRVSAEGGARQCPISWSPLLATNRS